MPEYGDPKPFFEWVLWCACAAFFMTQQQFLYTLLIVVGFGMTWSFCEGWRNGWKRWHAGREADKKDA